MKPEERNAGKYEITLKQHDGSLIPTQVELGYRDWNDKNGRNTECRIRLIWAHGEIESSDWNFFEAFKKIRQTLALKGLQPICYGVHRRVIVSGMLMDWDLGLSVYRVEENGEILEEPVCIFENGKNIEPVSIKAQEKFQAEWLETSNNLLCDSTQYS